MTILQTTPDILDNVLFRAGEPTDGTSDFDTHALNCINRAYRGIWMGGGEFIEEMNEPWLWLKKDPPGVLVLDPVTDTGTVVVTNNSAIITFSSAPATSQAGRFFKVDGHSDVFRIATHTAASATATLDTVYTGDTVAAANFKAMKLEYTLAADLLRPIAPMTLQADNEDEIDGIDLNSMQRDYPLSLIEGGAPDKFALVTETKIRFNRYGGTDSTDLIRVEYDYLYKPADLTDNAGSSPVVPLEHRQVLADMALFLLLSDKSDQRAEAIGTQARAGLRAMAADNRARMAQISRTFGAVLPRIDKVSTRRRWLRSKSGRLLSW